MDLLGGEATQLDTVGRLSDQIGGDDAQEPAGSGKESRGNRGFRTGVQWAEEAWLEMGNQTVAGDGLERGQRPTSGDVGALVGYGFAAGGSGSGGGSVLIEDQSGPTTPAYCLAYLTSQVGDDVSVVEHFVADFLELLDARLDSIASNLQRQDEDKAVVALLSLETSGAMLGATGLVAQARLLRSSVRSGRPSESSARLSEVQAAAEGLRRELLQRRSS